MTRYRLHLSALGLGLAFLVAACAGSSGSTTTGSTAATPTTTGSTTTGSTTSTAPVPTDQAACSTPAPLGSTAGAAACSVPTASCTAPAAPTPSQTEGPYFTPGSPEKASLVEAGMSGTPLTLSGYVVTTDCVPLPGAMVDIWQADANGVYDNAGYRLRGHVFTDSTGQFTIDTIVPGEYPGRTEHIHVKVTPSGGTTLTTQLYFPGVSANDSDGIFSPELLLQTRPVGDGYTATYTFVLQG